MAVHTLTDCPVPNPARVDLVALGDFPTTNSTSESLSLDAQNAQLAFPLSTLALEARASADSTDQIFVGFSEVSERRLDFVLWPQGSSCELYRGATYPGKLGGEAFGYAAASGLVLVAGNDVATGSGVVGALSFDTRTGESAVVDPRNAMVEPRAFATVSAFGQEVLVAGGEDPIHDSSQPASVLRNTAEVYDPATRGFQPNVLSLAVGSTRHAAITLESGETALIGGRIAASRASNFVQVVSPATRSAKLIGTLTVGRNAPSVLRLSDGRLLVAGGEDESQHPVPELEWRSADAGPLAEPFAGSVTLPPRFDRAFAALPGGAVLAVGGCEDRAPLADEKCAAWCQRGCPPSAGSADSEAFWISAQGSVTPLDFTIGAGRAVLLPGSDGRPWLIADAADANARPGQRALYRFDAWQQRFDAVSAGFTQELAFDARFVSTGPDAFTWLQQDERSPVLHGLRWGKRSEYSSDVPLFAHLAPDSPPSAGTAYDAALGTLAFAQLDPDAEGPCAWIGDAKYGDFTARIDFSSAHMPAIRLGARLLTDPDAARATDCALPPSGEDSGGSLRLKRRGDQLSITLGSARATCELGLQRVALGLCASDLGPTRVTLLEVTRGGS